MSSWGKNDNAANAPYWAVNSAMMNAAGVEQNYSAPTAANVALLYANTTANVYTSRTTMGLFAIDAAEQANNQQQHAIPHTGWVMKTVGQGGRAGRTQYEVLVTLNNVVGDGDGNTIANTANP
jgi:hypothetical protein